MVNLKSIACLMMGLIFSFGFAPLAKAGAAGVVVVAAEIMELSATLQNTGADPSGSLIRSLHQRLDKQAVNYALIQSNLDLMPRRIRSDINSAYSREVRTQIRLIRDDLLVQKPLANASIRLHFLQVANENLLQSPDHLMLLELVPSMYVEFAIIEMQPNLSAIDKQTARRVRQAAYRDRFIEVFERSRPDSMYERFSNADFEARESDRRTRKKLDGLRPFYEKNYERADCGHRWFTVSPEVTDFRDKMAGNQTALAYDAAMGIFRYIVEMAEYEFNSISYGHHYQKMPYPIVYNYNYHSNTQRALLQQVSRVYKSVPGSYYRDCESDRRNHLYYQKRGQLVP